MALFVKQDFTPPILSGRWIAIKCRPNMLLQSRRHVLSILESGLLFREDSAGVEQLVPSGEAVWAAVGAGYSGWLTTGERWLGAAAVGCCVAVFPPRLNITGRGACARLCVYAGVGVTTRAVHRRLARGQALPTLLSTMREYTALARRTMACLKEYRLLYRELGSVAAVLESALTLLWQQQSELAVLMSRCSSALLGNFPWLHEDVSWESVSSVSQGDVSESDLVKIHHAFLVVQSTLLKHIAMAHFIQSQNMRRTYLNHNERVYWLHNQILEHINTVFKENYESLDRMYRLLKNFGTIDSSNSIRRTGISMNDSWLYSDVHAGIARATIELKMALNKCNNLDMFFDSCASSKQEIDVQILYTDIEKLVEELTNCLTTVQNSQVKLRKLKAKFKPGKDLALNDNLEIKLADDKEIDTHILIIEDKEPESKDEVFFFVKTEEDEVNELSADLTTGPGKKERDATKVVLSELKRKLVKREDIMREREKVALVNTMPELRNNMPEFPRQMKVEVIVSKGGCVAKILKKPIKPLHTFYLIQSNSKRRNNTITVRFHKPSNLLKFYNLTNLRKRQDISCRDSTSNLKVLLNDCISKPDLLKRRLIFMNSVKTAEKDDDIDSHSSGMSEGLSDVEMSATNKNVNEAINKHEFPNHSQNTEAINLSYSKKDLDLSPSSSESDFDAFYRERKEQLSLLNDIRRHRVTRKKNHPVRRASSSFEKDSSVDNEVDEGLKPVEYSFGTGMALASMLQAKNGMKLPSTGQEEVFIGDGEVSSDSGDDDKS